MNVHLAAITDSAEEREVFLRVNEPYLCLGTALMGSRGRRERENVNLSPINQPILTNMPDYSSG